MYLVHELPIFTSLHIGKLKISKDLVEFIGEYRNKPRAIRSELYLNAKRLPTRPKLGKRTPNAPNRQMPRDVIWLIDLVNTHLIQKGQGLLMKGYEPDRAAVAEFLMHVIFHFDYYQTKASIQIPFYLRNFGKFRKKGETEWIKRGGDDAGDFERMRQAFECAYISTYRHSRLTSYGVELDLAIKYLIWYVDKYGSFDIQIFDIAYNDGTYTMV